MKPFSNLKTPPFFAILNVTVEEGGDTGLYSESIATLVSAAILRASFLGFTSDIDADENHVKISYWSAIEAKDAWQQSTKDLLPNRINLEDYLGLSGCLWPWINHLDESDIEQVIKVT